MSEHLTKTEINKLVKYYQSAPSPEVSLGQFLQRASKAKLQKIQKRSASKKRKPVGSVISQNNMKMLTNIYKENYNKKRTSATLSTYLRPLFGLEPQVLRHLLKNYDKHRNEYSFPNFAVLVLTQGKRSPLSTIQISR